MEGCRLESKIRLKGVQSDHRSSPIVLNPLMRIRSTQYNRREAERRFLDACFGHDGEAVWDETPDRELGEIIEFWACGGAEPMLASEWRTIDYHDCEPDFEDTEVSSLELRLCGTDIADSDTRPIALVKKPKKAVETTKSKPPKVKKSKAPRKSRYYSTAHDLFWEGEPACEPIIIEATASKKRRRLCKKNRRLLTVPKRIREDGKSRMNLTPLDREIVSMEWRATGEVRRGRVTLMENDAFWVAGLLCLRGFCAHDGVNVALGCVQGPRHQVMKMRRWLKTPPVPMHFTYWPEYIRPYKCSFGEVRPIKEVQKYGRMRCIGMDDEDEGTVRQAGYDASAGQMLELDWTTAFR